MKIFIIIFLSIFCSFPAQRVSDGDTPQVRTATDLFADDYGNIYVGRNLYFSFTKYDSLVNQLGEQMFTLPFKIQSVQNPLNIPAFSENAQEIRFYDQNLVEIQRIELRQKFGYVKMVYAEDQQQLWMLEESTKRLIQYNFRDERVINSFPFDIDFEDIIDLIVHDNTVYILTENTIASYGFQGVKLSEVILTQPSKLRRENSNILVVQKDSISTFLGSGLKIIFKAVGAQIVDKNSTAYFEIRDNKLYLYPIKN